MTDSTRNPYKLLVAVLTNHWGNVELDIGVRNQLDRDNAMAL